MLYFPLSYHTTLIYSIVYSKMSLYYPIQSYNILYYTDDNMIDLTFTWSSIQSFAIMIIYLTVPYYPIQYCPRFPSLFHHFCYSICYYPVFYTVMFHTILILWSPRTGRQHMYIKPAMPAGIPTNVKLMPQYFQQAGYITHAIGKWHLGFCHQNYTPTFRGFDTFYGFYLGSQGSKYLHRFIWKVSSGLLHSQLHTQSWLWLQNKWENIKRWLKVVKDLLTLTNLFRARGWW